MSSGKTRSIPRSILARCCTFSRTLAQLQLPGGCLSGHLEKFFFIASFCLVSARYNKSIGQVHEAPFLHARAQHIMQEIEAIARAKGIALPADLIERTFDKAATFPYQTPTSLQLDVHAGKDRTELDLFAGAILTYGEALGLPVPETQAIYQEIQTLVTTGQPESAAL